MREYPAAVGWIRSYPVLQMLAPGLHWEHIRCVSPSFGEQSPVLCRYTNTPPAAFTSGPNAVLRRATSGLQLGFSEFTMFSTVPTKMWAWGAPARRSPSKPAPRFSFAVWFQRPQSSTLKLEKKWASHVRSGKRNKLALMRMWRTILTLNYCTEH